MAVNLGTMVWGIKADTKEFSAAMAKVENIQKQIRAKERNDRLSQIEEARKVNKIRLEFEAQREQYLNARRRLSETASKEEIAQVEKIRKAYIKLGDTYDSATEKLAKNIRKNRAQLKGLNEELQLSKKSAGQLDGFIGKIGGINVGSLAKAAGIVGAVGAAGAAAFKKLVDNLDELAKRARDIGVTASQLQELQHQAKLAGISTGELDVSMRSFNRNVSLAAMGTGKAREALDSMGISVTYSNGQAKTQSELLKEVATYFAENAGEAENAGRAARIFGERGAEMLRIFEQGEGVVNKIFDANGIDEAAKAAEEFNNTLTDLGQIVLPTVYKYAGNIAAMLVKTFDPDRYFKAISSEAASSFKYISAETKKALIETDAVIAETAEKLKYTNKYIAVSPGAMPVKNPEYDRLQKQLDSLQKSREQLHKVAVKENEERIQKAEDLKRFDEERARAAEFEKENVKATDEAYRQLVKDAQALYKEDIKATDKRLKDLQRQKKQIEESRKKQVDSREEFELQTKIQILQAQGKTREAEALKFAKARNELMEKYGYSLKQAEQVQRTLNELQKAKGGDGKAEYSEEAKKQAQKVLERGEGGTIGKKTIEEAQAIMNGEAPKEGFTTSMFKKFEDDPKKKARQTSLKGGEFGLKGGQFALKNLNVDAKATAENLNDEAKTIEQKNSESLDSLVQQMSELNQKIGEMKNTVDGIAIKKKAI